MLGYDITPYRAEWREAYSAEAQLLKRKMGRNCFRIRQVGGTAIPYISSRPIIDMLVEVNNLERLENDDSALRRMGYSLVKREEKKLFYERTSGPLAYRLIVYQERALMYPYLAVRHRLMNDRAAAEDYSRFKTELYAQYGDSEEYERQKGEYLDTLLTTTPSYMQSPDGAKNSPATANPVAMGQFGAGMSIGIGVGVCFGVALGNIALGFAIGIGVGVCFGVALREAAIKKNNEKRDTDAQRGEKTTENDEHPTDNENS